MSHSTDGLTSKDPFFERMMDERIATLRAFLRMTTQKYQVPETPAPTVENDENRKQRFLSNSNVVELRRKR